MSYIFHEISKKPSYVRTEVGGWFNSIAYSRVQGGWVGQKRGDFERTYFMDDPFRVVLLSASFHYASRPRYSAISFFLPRQAIQNYEARLRWQGKDLDSCSGW